MIKSNPSVFHHFVLVGNDGSPIPARFSFDTYKMAVSFFNKYKKRKNVESCTLYGVYSDIWMPDAIIKSYESM